MGLKNSNDFAVQAAVFGEIDFAHASFADFLKNLVVRKRLAEHKYPPHRNAVALNVTT